MNQQDLFRALPSIDQVLKDDRTTPLLTDYGRESVALELKEQLGLLRRQIKENSQTTTRQQLTDRLFTATSDALADRFQPSLKQVHNLTGVILHTNLGRAPYPQNAIDAMVAVSRGASNLEFDLRTGKRGRRDAHVEQWICHLTGAEAATTVNNNAAAVLLVLNTLAEKKQVIVSRGELIEIGGSFRIPAIMKKASCKLREVGTTNRTHLSDYEAAIGKKTAALMKVHTSNYEINGFSHSVSASQLATLAESSQLPLIDDLGSGSLVDLTRFGLPPERTAAEAIAEGVDIITFSGDKLLGGPQCGIIAGRADLIKRIDRNPIKRAMRLDKVTLAALEAVLKLYTRPEQLQQQVPTLAMLSRQPDEIKITAERLATLMRPLMPASLELSVQPCESQIGSGALPTKTLPSFAVTIRPTVDQSDPARINRVEALAAAFRKLPVPIIGRIHDAAMWLDCRALTDPDHFRQILPSLKDALTRRL
ncbi:L-seryl-tRNA(Sec) selenium transferase [Chromatiales bacterium (ex Bugula neritina AB1)]|nr:L-seryl-tRNA(Sec) selenium transferase [Chromatiales bacterium (ex Bugula neritina AB1)]